MCNALRSYDPDTVITSRRGLTGVARLLDHIYVTPNIASTIVLCVVEDGLLAATSDHAPVIMEAVLADGWFGDATPREGATAPARIYCTLSPPVGQ